MGRGLGPAVGRPAADTKRTCRKWRWRRRICAMTVGQPYPNSRAESQREPTTIRRTPCLFPHATTPPQPVHGDPADSARRCRWNPSFGRGGHNRLRGGAGTGSLRAAGRSPCDNVIMRINAVRQAAQSANGRRDYEQVQINLDNSLAAEAAVRAQGCLAEDGRLAYQSQWRRVSVGTRVHRRHYTAVASIARLMPVLMPALISSLNRETTSRL